MDSSTPRKGPAALTSEALRLGGAVPHAPPCIPHTNQSSLVQEPAPCCEGLAHPTGSPLAVSPAVVVSGVAAVDVPTIHMRIDYVNEKNSPMVHFLASPAKSTVCEPFGHMAVWHVVGLSWVLWAMLGAWLAVGIGVGLGCTERVIATVTPHQTEPHGTTSAWLLRLPCGLAWRGLGWRGVAWK